MDSYFSLLMLDVPLLHYLSDALTVTNGNFAWVKSKWNTQGKDILLAGARQGTLLSLSFTPPFGLQHSFGFAFWGPLIWFRKDLVLLQLIVWSTLTLVELGARLENLQEFLTADVLYVFFCFVILFFFNFTTTYTRMLWMRWRSVADYGKTNAMVAKG